VYFSENNIRPHIGERGGEREEAPHNLIHPEAAEAYFPEVGAILVGKAEYISMKGNEGKSAPEGANIGGPEGLNEGSLDVANRCRRTGGGEALW